LQAELPVAYPVLARHSKFEKKKNWKINSVPWCEKKGIKKTPDLCELVVVMRRRVEEFWAAWLKSGPG
jgi:hypothetical protein